MMEHNDCVHERVYAHILNSLNVWLPMIVKIWELQFLKILHNSLTVMSQHEAF
jgi:hypothetical protein